MCTRLWGTPEDHTQGELGIAEVTTKSRKSYLEPRAFPGLYEGLSFCNRDPGPPVTKESRRSYVKVTCPGPPN